MNEEEAPVPEEPQEFLETVSQDCMANNNVALSTESLENEQELRTVFIKGEPCEQANNQEDCEELEREDDVQEEDIKPGIL